MIISASKEMAIGRQDSSIFIRIALWSSATWPRSGRVSLGPASPGRTPRIQKIVIDQYTSELRGRMQRGKRKQGKRDVRDYVRSMPAATTEGGGRSRRVLPGTCIFVAGLLLIAAAQDWEEKMQEIIIKDDLKEFS